MSVKIKSFEAGNAIVTGNDLYGLEVGDRLYTEAEMYAETPLSSLTKECIKLSGIGVKSIDPTVVGRLFLKAIGLAPDGGLCVKQERYKDSKGKDTIDKWIERYPLETFRVIMWIQMEKYNDRLGKKDSPVEEVRKIADYAARWLQVEEGKL